MVDNIKATTLELTNALKTVLKENISKNPVTLAANRDRITAAYNNLIIEIRKLYPVVNDQDKTVLKTLFLKNRERICTAYNILNCNYHIPEAFYSLICPNTRNVSGVSEISTPIIRPSSLKILSIPGTSSEFETELTENNTDPSPELEPNNIRMEELTPVEFLKLCASNINKNYDGNPLSLQSFLDSIDLLKITCSNQNLMNILFKFVVSKLEGNARELISNEHNTLDAVINQLKLRIKCENSKVVEG